MLKNRNHILRIVFILFALILSSCINVKAYFNTFYNAEDYFKKAEAIRIKSSGEDLPKTAIDYYQKSIQKSNIVIINHPKSTFRKRALNLIIVSNFYIGDYDKSLKALSDLQIFYKKDSLYEFEFWTALIKWKKGKAQPAINALSNLLTQKLNPKKRAQIFLSIAEIYYEQKMLIKSMDYLEKAAVITKDQLQKGQLYYRIANISFNQKDYKRALLSYREVIKNSKTKKRIQESHFKSIQIYRLQGNFDKAANSIKNMLLDENFQTIYPSLELELSKLYGIQGNHDDAIVRLESIIKDYPNTSESAESYFILGNYSLSAKWDLKTALKNFGMVSRENRGSFYSKPSILKIKEITRYNKLLSDFQKWKYEIVSNDTAQSKNVDGKSLNLISEKIYELAELEAFHFSRKDTALKYLEELMLIGKVASIYPKALYTKAMILRQLNLIVESNKIKDLLINSYPKTDFAKAFLSSSNSRDNENNLSHNSLLEAENLWRKNGFVSFSKYHKIVDDDSISESSARAAYFLAYQYDFVIIKPDSALIYYNWIIKHHSSSEQANSSKKRVLFLSSFINEATKNKN